MAGKTKTKLKTRRVTYTSKQGEQREISISSRYDESVVSVFKELVKLLSDSQRFGTRLSNRDLSRVELLPSELRNKLIVHQLVEGKAAEKIPTVSQVVKQYRATLFDVKELTLVVLDRHCNYLLEYFGKDKRIDLITCAEAGGIRHYLLNERTAKKGKLKPSSVNRAITTFKAVFSYSVDCNYLEKSPFAKIKGGATTNSERQYYVTDKEITAVIRACGNDAELAGILAFARYAGLRIPSEIRDLQFSDFDESCFSTGKGNFRVPDSGKTGMRRVPFFDELKPSIEAIRSAALPDQRFVFEKYRYCKNVRTLIQKKMQKAGLKIWEKFFVNLRSSCQTDKERLGWTRSVMDAVFGNSEQIRIQHYIQPLPDEEYAALGRRKGLPMEVPAEISVKLPIGDGWFSVIRSAFRSAGEMFGALARLASEGIVGRTKQVPIEIPIISGDFSHQWAGVKSFSDVLKQICPDRLLLQKLNDFIRSRSHLQLAVSELNFALERGCDDSYWQVPPQDFIKREMDFIQKFSRHFTEFAEEIGTKEKEKMGGTGLHLTVSILLYFLYFLY